AVISIAGAFDRADQSGITTYTATTHECSTATIAIASWTDEGGLWGDNASLLGGQRSNDFENRARWIRRLNRTIKHRFGRVVQQLHVIIATLTAHHHVRIIARAADIR